MADDRQTRRSSASRNRFTGRVDPQAFLTGGVPAPGEPWQTTVGREHQNIENALGAGIAEATRLRDETDLRRDQQLDFLNQEQALASQPSVTQEELAMRQGQAAGQATVDAQALMRSLREQMGQSGVRGGTAAGMGAQVEMQRLGQIQDANTDLRIYKANADAKDRIDRYMRAFGISEVMGREPSPFLSDAIQTLAGVRLHQQQLGINRRLGVFGINAAKDAQPSFGEQMLGNAIGIGTSFLPG